MSKRRVVAAAAVVACLAWAALPVPSAALSGGGSLFALQNANLVAVDPASGTLSTVADLSTLVNQPALGPLAASSQSSLIYAVGTYCSPSACPNPRGGGTGVPTSEIITIDSQTAAVQVSPVLAAPIFGGIALDQAAGTLWALTPPYPGYPGSNPSIAILRVDPITGAETTVATHVGEVNTGNSWVALDAASHVLYVATLNDLTGAGQLLALDTSTGTLSAGLNLAAPVSGLLYDASLGALFGVTTGTPEQLAQIDPATGTETAIATFGADIKVIDPTIDSASHTVFGVEYNTLTVAPNQIVTLNDQTGVTSVGVSVPFVIDNLAFAPMPPSVSSVAPKGGPLIGGTSVTITGTDFTGVTAVNFGTTPAASYTVNSATQITSMSPAGTGGGTVDVTVAAAGGTSATSSADTFTYGLSAPRAVAATAGDGSATVSWTAPAFDGGSAITGYVVTGSPSGTQTLNCPCTTLQAMVGALTNGVSYTFTVHATNGLGSGPESAPSNGVSPAGVPGAPTNVIATGGESEANVSWTAPVANGGSPVTGYRITPYVGAVARGPISAGLVTSFHVTGLVDGTAYTFSVATLNAVAASGESVRSNSVTPWHLASGPVIGRPMVGDFSGDGKSDLALISSSGISVALSNGAAFSAPSTWAPFPFYGTVATLAGDVTGDGKADLVAVNAGQVFVLPSTGTSFGPPSAWSNIAFYGTRGTFLADVNGDGKADLVAVNNTSVWVMLSTGTGFAPPVQWSSTPFYGNLSTQIADVTGDGKADLVAINSTSVWVLPSTGSGFGAPAQWSAVPFYGNVQTMLVDANGDGKVDLVALNSTSTWIMTSTGAGFGPPTQWSATAFYGVVATLSGDLTGNHNQDLIAINPTSVWVALSSGSALSAPQSWW